MKPLPLRLLSSKKLSVMPEPGSAIPPLGNRAKSSSLHLNASVRPFAFPTDRDVGRDYRRRQLGR